MMDIGYRAGQQLMLALLDWEKAVDKLDQEAMHEALGRMNLPTKYKNLIRELYKHPIFKMEMDGHSDPFCPVRPWPWVCMC